MGKSLLDRYVGLFGLLEERGEKEAARILKERALLYRDAIFGEKTDMEQAEASIAFERVVNYFETKLQLLTMAQENINDLKKRILIWSSLEENDRNRRIYEEEIKTIEEGLQLLERTFKAIEELENEILLLKEEKKILTNKVTCLIERLKKYTRINYNGKIEFFKRPFYLLQEEVMKQEERGLNAS